MPKRVVIIVGSARRDGETMKAAQIVHRISGWDLIDLNDHKIGFYDYEHSNIGDDYLPLIRRIIANYDVLVFATPVYWYAMSGQMKVFFDRITDLLDHDKALGRKLRGKSMAAMSCSAGDNLGDNFWLPFSETARYLGMRYLGNIHTYEDSLDEAELRGFVESIDRFSGEA